MKPKVIKITDQPNLISTSEFPFAKFPFPKFNPPQSRIFEVCGRPVNCVAAAPTSAGKTVIGELFIANEVRSGGKGMYLSPLRALSQEKVDDWRSKPHHFSDLRIAICTGDYRLTPHRNHELNAADVIIMTSEMLNSKARNCRSEQSEFLQQIKTLVVDEGQLIGAKGRGDHLESGLMKFAEINPAARIIMLSATLPNVDEIGEWLCSLNGKDTVVLESNYRPCPLHVHYVKYEDVPYGYEENERAKVRACMNLVETYNDKFILFVHTKRTGDLLTRCLKEAGIRCDYHNADLTKERRNDIERRFREDPSLKVIVATSGLAQGLNMPARRVVVLGIHRGLSEIETNDVFQMCGRGGRPQYDPCGDAYVLLPARSFTKHKTRLEELQPIRSQMLDAKTLAFHLTSEIHHRTIRTLDDIYAWHHRSLAAHQNVQLDEDVVTEVVGTLTRCGAIVEKQNRYDVTSVGTISSMFYYSPFDVSDLSRNFGRIFERDKEANDYWLAMALGHTDSNRLAAINSADREEVGKFKKGLDGTSCEKALAGGRDFTDGVVKAGCCYYNLLKGYNSTSLGGAMRGTQIDSERLCEVLGAMDQMTGKWGRQEFFKRLYLRLLYGVGEEMVSICRLKGVGKIKAKRLWDANLRDLETISSNTLGVIKALNCSKNVAGEISKNAKELLLVG